MTANNRDVDFLMKGPNFLEVQKFPEARFVSSSISVSGERYEARGKLTIRDVTRDVVLPFTLTIVDDPGPARPAPRHGPRQASWSSASTTAWGRTSGPALARSPTKSRSTSMS